MDNKYENSGNLFPANNSEIVRQGRVDIDGLDHELVIIKTITPKKKMTIYEIHKQVGVLYVNEEKSEDKDWDISGDLEINGEKHKAWGRKREDKNGDDYTRMSFAPAKDSAEKYKDKEAEPSQALDDDIPF